MIATQLYPPPTFPENRDRDAAQYLPAKDVESFKKLLPPPIEFVEGSSSGTLAIGEGKYQPINGTPSTLPQNDTTISARTSQPPPSTPSSTAAPQAPSGPAKSLWTRPIDTTWPNTTKTGCGLNNTGNTCFLNSALQCLIHTPPLVRILSAHNQSDPCSVKKGAFCMACALRSLMSECFSRRAPTTPYQISSKLSEIAKHMRRGRQEDSHEFLRYAIDALQKACLAGYPPKLDHKIAVTTWVHKIFGGKLRSRVTCLSCGYNSDTFDDMLDLSVDIFGSDSLQKALRKFVAVDHLKGADKYKCDKCKKHVSADKSFTVHEAPAVLSVHLKRFTPMGRKMGQLVRYDDQLSLQPVMSDGQFGPTYSLYGVISHAGGGPNSGHYYAHVKSSNGQWFEMNDESVTRVPGAPTNMKNAYILFYLRNKGQALEAAVSAPSATPKKLLPSPVMRTNVVAGMKKRRIDDDDDDDKPPASKPFIGPRLPSPAPERERASSPPEAKKQRPNPPDPQAQLLKQKIAAAASSQTQTSSQGVPQSPTKALLSLSQYKDDSDDSGDDMGEKVEKSEDKMDEDKSEGPAAPPAPSSSTNAPPNSPTLPSPALTEHSLPALTSSATASSSNVVSASSFYSTAGSKVKGKDRDTSSAEDLSTWAKTPITPPSHQKRPLGGSSVNRYSTGNPFSSRLTGSNNLKQQRDGTGGAVGSVTKRMKKRSMAV